MTIVRKLFLGSVGVALAVAAGCGGSTDGGTPAPGVDAGVGSDASMAADTSMAGDTGSQMDSGGGGGMGTVPCGMGQTCNLPAQECCLSAGEGGLTAACTAAGACTGSAVACASTANCSGGQVCCAQQSGNGISSACAPSPCGAMQGQLCMMSSECPMGDTCRNLGGGFRVCAPQFDGGRRDGGGMRDAGGGG